MLTDSVFWSRMTFVPLGQSPAWPGDIPSEVREFLDRCIKRFQGQHAEPEVHQQESLARYIAEPHGVQRSGELPFNGLRHERDDFRGGELSGSLLGSSKER